MKRVLVLNGVNLNMLGKRDRSIYGSGTLKDLEKTLLDFAKGKDVELEFFCSNFEGEIVEKLQQDAWDFVLLNPGAYTHYSYAIADAVGDMENPVCEVHLSDIKNREDFRKFSVLEDVVKFSSMGKGFDSYVEALARFLELD